MCVWLASFDKDALATMNVALITSINDVLKTVRTEKVIRMALLAVENLLKSKTMCEGRRCWAGIGLDVHTFFSQVEVLKFLSVGSMCELKEEEYVRTFGWLCGTSG